MGCGKSKHDVVTGNTRTVKKPSEEKSVKGKENETIKRQESCRCQKTKDVSVEVSADQPETTVENNTKKPEEKETTTLPPVTAIVPENIVTVDTANDVNENVLPVDEQKEDEIETVVEEGKSIDDQISGDVDTETPPLEVEEPKPDVQIVTTENVETASTENDKVSV